MSVIGSNILAGASGQAVGYQVSRSLRFNSSDSAYLSRTPASAGNRKTWTYSFWFKLGKTTGYQYFFSANNPSGGGSSYDILQMDNNASTIVFYGYNGSSHDWILSPTAVFRDPSAWQHFVIAFDTTQATASNRVKWWHNGNLLVLDRSGYTTYPSLNLESRINNAVSQRLSDQTYGLNSYLADVHFIDGQALDPTSFTEVDATTGQLIPKQYTGSFGTNGFWLKFSDNSAATATTLGKDYSGNSNNWTPNNLSVTAGAGNDSLVDTPTSYGTDTGAGGEVRGNYCTLNPLAKGGDIQAPTNGNLQVTSSGSGYGLILGTIGMSSGKWYWEVTTTSANCATGIATNLANLASYGGADAYSWVWASYSGGSNKRNNNSNSSYGSILANGDVVGIAFDADNGTLTFYKNNVSQGAAYTGLAAGTYLPVLGDETTAANIDLTVNFGQRQWAYAAPSGFRPLVDTLLPSPVVAKPNTVFNVITYTGTGANATIPNVNTVPTSIAFTPDLVWIKGRSGATDHALYDSVRDVQKDLVSNSTAAETTQSTGLTAFGTNTFDIGTLAKLNTSSSTYVGWCWDAGSAANPTTNTQGSITSQVRANPSAGFSIITFTMGSGSYTVGHGLNTAPSLLITKARSNTSSWWTYHASLGTGSYLALNSTAAAASDYSWGSAPTSTVFTANNDFFTNGYTYVVYAFSPVAGYSNAFSFTGNGSSDGPMVWLGFKPRFLFIKRTDSTSYWHLYDTARNTYNVTNSNLWANGSDAEITNSAYDIDILSNGFKLRTSDAARNASGGSYVGFAWAENPFQYARAR